MQQTLTIPEFKALKKTVDGKCPNRKHKKQDEYYICKEIAAYIRQQYPSVIFHFDLAGLNLSKTQAGMMKAIQGRGGYPDLFIVEPKGFYHGLMIELKANDIYKKDGITLLKNEHIEAQAQTIKDLNHKNYYACFGIGFPKTKNIIDNYMAGLL